MVKNFGDEIFVDDKMRCDLRKLLGLLGQKEKRSSKDSVKEAGLCRESAKTALEERRAWKKKNLSAEREETRKLEELADYQHNIDRLSAKSEVKEREIAKEVISRVSERAREEEKGKIEDSKRDLNKSIQNASFWKGIAVPFLAVSLASCLIGGFLIYYKVAISPSTPKLKSERL